MERRWRMFRWLCSALARSVGADEGEAPPLWPDDPADVEALITLAGHHMVTPALAIAARANGTVPPLVSEYLEATLFLNRERNAQMLGALETAATVLAARGITPVLLKGAANLADELYPDPAMRIANDLDLLVTPESASAASRALAEAGFDDFEGGPDGAALYARHHHLPMQCHRESGVGIELHHTVLERPYRRLLDPARVHAGALLLEFRGRPLTLPSPTHRVLHNIVHDQLSDGAYARMTVSLRQLLDLSLLCRRYHQAIDWDELRASFAGRHAPVLPYDLGLARLLGASPPVGSLAESLPRLRQGVEKPRSHLRVKLRRIALHLVHRPGDLRKLLAPGIGPRRWERWAASAAPPRA
jgi:hypothetical protein